MILFLSKLFSVILVEIFFILFFSKFAKVIDLLDYPDSRKTHQGNIPLVGGLCVFLTLVFTFFLVETTFQLKIILISCFIILFVGLYDDKYKLGITERFFFQIIACLIVVGFGIRIHDIGQYNGFVIGFGGFGILLSFITIIAYTNAINFVDGLDGLASGLILNCLFSIIVFSYFDEKTNNIELLIFVFMIVGIFFIANFGIILPKIFLGDSGSTSLGFLISCLLVYYTLPENRYFHPILTLWCAPLPTFDLLTVFFRRAYNKINPFNPDRRHLHYLMLSRNYSGTYVTFFLILTSFLLSFFGFITYYFKGSAYSAAFFVFLFIIYLLYSLYMGKENNFQRTSH
ncbi:MAG: hypothetical protein CMI57_00505 [Parcubacteria group bacterium]|nr:hypothetical protein [Parcubacteria group bacterium]